MIKNSSIIKGFRAKKGISQLEVAKRLGISRSSYIAVEQGKRELSLAEARKLANIFGVTLGQLESGLVPDYAKYKEMILAYLRNARSSDGKVLKTKLAKLLYLADFAWFYHNLKSMSGMPYRKFQYGPVPDSYFRAIDELEEDGKIEIKRENDMILISENEGSQKQPLHTLDREELALIKDIAEKWKNKRTGEIVDFTHNQLPYKLCRPDEIIPYELITQEGSDHVY